MSAETVVRDALRRAVGSAADLQTVDEFWVPRSNERADLAVVGPTLDGFEIKTHVDTLGRLPRQIGAYGRLFDRCTAVVADKHRPEVERLVPEWWGLMSVKIDSTQVVFHSERAAGMNPSIDPETLVRLLWRDEAASVLTHFGRAPSPGATRGSMWRDILTSTTIVELRMAVRTTLVNRDPATARIATRRFTNPKVKPQPV